MDWKRLLAGWQRLKRRVEAAWTAYDRLESKGTAPVEVVSTEGWSEEERRAWLESKRRAHALWRATRRRSRPD